MDRRRCGPKRIGEIGDEADAAILVTGATGKQGGAVVAALLHAGRSVRAMTRDPQSDAAQALAAQGVEVVKGDFNDAASLDAALAGVGGVFSMQMGSHPGDPDTEIVTGIPCARHRL